MEITKQNADSLKRYFLNANPFLWGIMEGNRKKERILELQKMGFLMGYSENSKQTYDAINTELLVDLGVEGILSRIVVPTVYKRLGSDSLKRFQRYWEQGQKPEFRYLLDNQLYKIHRVELMTRLEENHEVPDKDPALIFLDVNQQLKFVEQWTVFAGVWFEIIEPLLTNEDKAKYEKRGAI
jgi:hypothetical protein